jgi:cytochrome b561
MATVPDGIAPVTRYNATARALHAVIAVLVIANLALGLLHEALEKTVNLIPLHKSIGLTVLAVSLARVLWRFTWQTPIYAPAIGRVDVAVAKVVHVAFYALIILMPLTGWIMSSAGTKPLAWFGIPVAKFAVAKGSPLAEAAHEGHELMGWLLLALAVLHVAAALRHHFILKDGVLRRMW